MNKEATTPPFNPDTLTNLTNAQPAVNYGAPPVPPYGYGANPGPGVNYNNNYGQGQPYYPPQPGYSNEGHRQTYFPPPQPGYNNQSQQSSNVVVVSQPTSITAPPSHGQIQNIRGWSTGLCGCCLDLDSCCLACWCYPCFLCQLATRMDECLCGPFICGSCYSCVTLLRCFGIDFPMSAPNVFLVGMRSKLRGKHGIYGSVCEDLCTIWCCEFCAVTQLSRELKHLGALR